MGGTSKENLLMVKSIMVIDSDGTEYNTSKADAYLGKSGTV